MVAQTFPELTMPETPFVLPAPEPLDAEIQWAELTLSRSHELEIYRKEAERRDAVAKRARLDRFADPTVGERGFSETRRRLPARPRPRRCAKAIPSAPGT